MRRQRKASIGKVLKLFLKMIFYKITVNPEYSQALFKLKILIKRMSFVQATLCYWTVFTVASFAIAVPVIILIQTTGLSFTPQDIVANPVITETIHSQGLGIDVTNISQIEIPDLEEGTIQDDNSNTPKKRNGSLIVFGRVVIIGAALVLVAVVGLDVGNLFGGPFR
jgi:hypothetical protein